MKTESVGMTDAELDAIAARLALASDTPWMVAGGNRIISRHGKSTKRGAEGVTIRIGETFAEIFSVFSSISDPWALANAKFIASAPTDIAALLAEVRRLRGQP